MYHGVSDEVIPYASALKTAVAWCANGAAIEFVSETGGTGHVGTFEVLLGNATAWLDLRLSGVDAAEGCSNATDSASGSAERRKRSAAGMGMAIERFGEGDGKIIADMRQRKANGLKIPGLWTYLWSV